MNPRGQHLQLSCRMSARIKFHVGSHRSSLSEEPKICEGKNGFWVQVMIYRNQKFNLSALNGLAWAVFLHLRSHYYIISISLQNAHHVSHLGPLVAILISIWLSDLLYQNRPCYTRLAFFRSSTTIYLMGSTLLRLPAWACVPMCACPFVLFPTCAGW